jgi:limonene-1,2-epoxide hydrolase
MSPAHAAPLEVVRQFMKLMEPLDYDAALKLVCEKCEYTNPPIRHGPRPL